MGKAAGKALRVVGTIVGVAAAGLAIATGVGAIAAGATILGLSASTLGGIAAVAALGGSLLSPKPKAPAASPAARDRLFVSIDPRTPRKMVFGRTAMATDIRDQEYTGDQDYFHRFVVAASHRVQAIEEIWFDDKRVWTAAGGVEGEAVGYLTVTPILEGSAANAINISPRMGSTRRYTGCAYVHLRYKLKGNSKNSESPYAQTIPTRVTIRGKGALVYDPRLDSTVGGSGPQRADDQSSWAWNDNAARNPALQELWYELGWRINGKLAVGKGVPPARLDLASYITAANTCDESVAKADGSFEPRYRSDGVFSEGDAPSLVRDSLKASMNATLDDMDGRIRLTVINNDLATPIADFTEDDIIDGVRWDQTPPLQDTFNLVRGSYTDPSDQSLYQLVDYPEVALASIDGIERPDTFDLPLVQSPSQAQRLAKQRAQRMQYPGLFRANYQATAWRVQKGDVVRQTFGPLGWYQKLFRVVDIEVRVDGVVAMVLREEHPSIYAWSASEAPAVAAAAPTTYDWTKNPLYADIKALEDGASLFTLIAGANVAITPNSVTKASGGTDWNAGAYSLEGHAGDVMVVGRVADAAHHLMIGLNTDPATNDIYSSIDFAAYCDAGVFRAYESGDLYGSSGTVSTGDFIYVRRRGTTIEYGVLGEASPRLTHPGVSATTKLHLDTSIYETGAGFTNLSIQPVGADGVSPPLITLTADKREAKYNAADSYVGGAITFTATRQNIPGTQTYFRAFRLSDGALLYADTANNFGSGYGGAFAGSGGDIFVITPTFVDAILTEHGAIRVEAFRDGYSVTDSVSIAKIKDGAPGLNAPLVLTQFSVTGTGGWHSEPTDDDFYARQSNDGGGTWGDAYRIRGEDGEAIDGKSPSVVFKRSATVPGTPDDNSGDPPTGWSDGPPAPPGLLWQSKATFREGVQLTSWSAPVRISGEAGAPGLTASLAPPTIGIAADSAGNPKSGQIPATAQVTILSGTTNATADATHAIHAVDGCTASVNSAGAVSIDTVSADKGYAIVRSTYGGAEIDQKLPFARTRDGAAGSSASDTSPSAPTSTSYTVVSQVLEIAVGPGGEIGVSFSAALEATGGDTIYAAVERRAKGDATWLAFSGASASASVSPGEPGFLIISAAMAGPVSVAVWEFRLVAAYATGNLSSFAAYPFLVKWRP